MPASDCSLKIKFKEKTGQKLVHEDRHAVVKEVKV